MLDNDAECWKMLESVGKSSKRLAFSKHYVIPEIVHFSGSFRQPERELRELRGNHKKHEYNEISGNNEGKFVVTGNLDGIDFCAAILCHSLYYTYNMNLAFCLVYFHVG